MLYDENVGAVRIFAYITAVLKGTASKLTIQSIFFHLLYFLKNIEIVKEKGVQMVSAALNKAVLQPF